MKNLIAIAAVMLILIPAISQAQHCKLLMMADELDLTDQQIEQISANASALRMDMIQLRANLKKARLEINELMIAKQIDKRAVLKKSETISAIEADIAKKKLANRIDRLNMLDKNQRAKIRKNMMLHGPDMGRGHGFGQGHGFSKGHGGGPCDGHYKGHKMKRGMGGGRNIEVTIEKEVFEDVD